MPFAIPPGVAPGSYNLRLFENSTYIRLATSNTITVTACSGTTLTSPANVAPGETITVNWTGICAPATNDWIGLYTPGAPDNPSITWKYTSSTTANGSTPFTIPASLAPGTYELRLFSQNTYVRLATTATFTVAKPDLNPTAITLYKTVWPTSAVASSQYSSSSYSATQATGVPNVTSCGNNTLAWSPSTNGSGGEWIEVTYSNPVPAIGVLVHETYTAGFVYRIDLKDTSDNYTTIWTGTDNTPCNDWFSLTFPQTSYSVKAVKVYTQKAGWEEIDAIGLVINETPSIPAGTQTHVAASWVVNNLASSSALPSWTDTVYVSTDTVCCTGDTSLGGFAWTAPVQGQTSYTHMKPIKIPALSAGTYNLIVKVDSASILSEQNETNNEYSIPFTVSP